MFIQQGGTQYDSLIKFVNGSLMLVLSLSKGRILLRVLGGPFLRLAHNGVTQGDNELNILTLNLPTAKFETINCLILLNYITQNKNPKC